MCPFVNSSQSATARQALVDCLADQEKCKRNGDKLSLAASSFEQSLRRITQVPVMYLVKNMISQEVSALTNDENKKAERDAEKELLVKGESCHASLG